MNNLIYCVEDDNSIRGLVVYALKTAGFFVKGFENANEFYQELNQNKPVLVLLDIMLPDEDGMMILKKLRSRKDTERIPVILLTAKSAEYDKVKGLDEGADDYITKPFGVMELISRVKAVLRRSVYSGPNLSQWKWGELSVDEKKREVRVGNQLIELTYKEFELLIYLMKNQGIVLSREQILNTIWNYDYEGESRTVDVHIGSLRQKLGACADMIKTVRGVGYKLENRDEKENL